LIGAVAGADLSAASTIFKFVKFSGTTSSAVVLCAATTDIPCGVLQAPAPTSDTGQPVEVTMLGETKLNDDGTSVASNIVGTNASGQSTPILATMYPVGRIVVASGASGAFATAVVNCVAPTVKA
jgi:hypothetical protein